MYLYEKLISILLLSLPGIMSETTENSQLTALKNQDEQCGSYCFGILKPFIEKVSSLQPRKEKAKKFREMESLDNYCLIKEDFIDQIIHLIAFSNNIENKWMVELKNKDFQILNQTVKISSLEKRLTEKENEMKAIENKLIVDLKNKDSEISNLKSQEKENSAIIGKLRKNLTDKENEINNLSSCIGKETGIHEIKLPGSSAFNVSCDTCLAGSGWTVIQRRQDGSVDFNRTMRDYRKGFGALDGEFFIGLDKLHLLTKSRKHELYIYMKKFNDESRYARYSHFFIKGEEDSFKIKSLGNYTGDAGDAMADNLYKKFTTIDEDHDNWFTGNCADFYAAGWWFHNCGNSRLNGKYQTADLAAKVRGINWISWTLDSLKFVQMMIRPVE
ncbi:fibrinogen-like protein 1 isoform X1 [Drosophila mojavensis]|uniref:Uncharacterized protein, isoform A n=1 Tax=Drosophila mojavensis TaxID=7230 RepID=A0A0Q9XBY5_DROMO|nr:fibrinogen-like protein 1 isoform X1 [Drosophila mojavensis]KRG03018.1 uncharacterized protein Dmoj_GI25639, isoform A [Drosophila mojavensis]